MLDSFGGLVRGDPAGAPQSAPSPGLLAALALAIAVAAYFLGCSNGAILVSKYILHNDIRTHGSGNAGLTNFHRVFGGRLTLVVILTDVVKAVLAVCFGLLAVWLVGWPGLSTLPNTGQGSSACWAIWSPACSAFGGARASSPAVPSP